jgi:hypothetical protein
MNVDRFSQIQKTGFNDVWVSHSNDKDIKMSVEDFTEKFNVI